ncbi:MAG: hypothetical protein CMJ31_14280 [Phycisphaerae bacterium]|nr:hypothetical protein [Phycisphaerae bacterium]
MSVPTVIQYRIGAAVLSLACLALLGVAAVLPPSSEGHGTHESLGLPRCGWVAMFDAPCPTCGMTTSFAHAADGSLLTAIKTQPAGGTLALIVAVIAIGAAHAALTGVATFRLLSPLRRPLTLWLALASILAAWIYKIVTW